MNALLDFLQNVDGSMSPEQNVMRLADAPYFANVRAHPTLPLTWQLTYDQFQSPKGDPIGDQLRGHIVSYSDAFGGWDFVARPFDRFYNIGEFQCAVKVDELSKCTVQEKLDGSLIIAYYAEGSWHLATKGSPDAGGGIGGFLAEASNFEGTFGDLARAADPELYSRLDNAMGTYSAYSRNYTYMLELTAPENRVVIPYAERGLTLLAVRHKYDGDYVPLDAVHWTGRKVGSRDWSKLTAEEIVADVNKSPGMESEGVVVCTADGRRGKCKNLAYVHLHHALDEYGARSIWDVFLTGETPEVAAYFPQVRARLDHLQTLWDAWCAVADSARHRYLPNGSVAKEDKSGMKALAAALFADQQLTGGLRTYLFSYAREGVLPSAWLRAQTVSKIREILDV
jgi:hypothetical protein